LISEPDPVKKTVSEAFNIFELGPIKAIPEGFTIYDKVTVK